MLIELRNTEQFTVERVNSLLPVIVKITKQYKLDVENKFFILEQISSSKTERVQSLEAEIDSQIAAWKEKMKRLGATPAGLWCLDFDNGKGYYCWKFPEEKIAYKHSYQEGFTNRRPIVESSLPFN